MVDSKYEIGDDVYLITNARKYLQNGQVPLMVYSIVSIREMKDVTYYKIKGPFGDVYDDMSEVVLYNKKELKILFDGILRDVRSRYNKALEKEHKNEQLLLFY